MRRWLPAVAGIGLSAVFVALLLWQVDLGRVADVLARAQLILLPLALIGLAVDLVARAVRWRLLLAREPRPGHRETFRYLVIGYLANNLLPGRAGELVRAHLMGTRAGVGRTRALGSIVLERGLDLASASLLGAAAGAAAGADPAIIGVFAAVATGSCAALAAAALLPHRLIRRTVDRLAIAFEHRPARAVLPRLAAFTHGFLDAASPRVVAQGFLLSVVAWVATAAVFGVVVAALGLTLSPLAVLAVAMAANLGLAIPSAPAGVGPFEFAVVLMAASVGVDPGAALALGVVVHLATALPVSAAGAYELAQLRWNLGRLRRLAGMTAGVPDGA
ncbi:MAG TPA: lysylphosphatidylglycerol synthase transmembrane domain-containing protein [Candidatus Limnocylindrales bacterium]|nr:lysylphosphatidylglycerol synthase transmembrane domain-containing protein [Candidatus Limnocylindrales bacterium]